MNLKLTALVALSLVVAASPSRAQLLVAKDAPIAYGHHHLNVTSIPADVKFFETLGGTPITVAGRSIVKFPNVLVFLREQKPTAGTKGSSVDHIGFWSRRKRRRRRRGWPPTTSRLRPAVTSASRSRWGPTT